MQLLQLVLVMPLSLALVALVARAVAVLDGVLRDDLDAPVLFPNPLKRQTVVMMNTKVMMTSAFTSALFTLLKSLAYVVYT